MIKIIQKWQKWWILPKNYKNHNFRFDGTSTIYAQTSNYAHYMTSLGNLQNTPVAVGGWYPDNYHIEHFENGNWKTKSDFSFVNDYIYYYSMATLDENLFLFGGTWDSFNDSNSVAKFNGEIWTMTHNLLEGRTLHRSIVQGNTIFHIGGYYTKFLRNKKK